MQQTLNKEADKFELYLEDMIVRLQACQDTKNVNSCSDCGMFFDCELRRDYVNAVYNSMSKGDTGGFEF